jgi:ribosomal protein L37E
MYCPKCSQQQVSEEVRFCSRCGFSLSAVRELIAGSESAPRVSAPHVGALM